MNNGYYLIKRKNGIQEVQWIDKNRTPYESVMELYRMGCTLEPVYIYTHKELVQRIKDALQHNEQRETL